MNSIPVFVYNAKRSGLYAIDGTWNIAQTKTTRLFRRNNGKLKLLVHDDVLFVLHCIPLQFGSGRNNRLQSI